MPRPKKKQRKAYLLPASLHSRRHGRRRLGRVAIFGQAEPHDLFGRLRRVLALLHELRHLSLWQPHAEADRAIGRRLGEREIGDGSAGEHEALQALLGAHVERPGPGAPLVREAGKLYKKVELPRPEGSLGLQRPGPEAQLLDLLGIEDAVARVIPENTPSGGRGLETERGPVYLHHLSGPLLSSYGITHLFSLSRFPLLGGEDGLKEERGFFFYLSIGEGTRRWNERGQQGRGGKYKGRAGGAT